jgi:hypothetical protein
MMKKAHIDKASAVPWWAAFGAPLLGVPILVALLALGSGEATKADVKAMESGYEVEQVDLRSVESAVELPPKESAARSRC